MICICQGLLKSFGFAKLIKKEYNNVPCYTPFILINPYIAAGSCFISAIIASIFTPKPFAMAVPNFTSARKK